MDSGSMSAGSMDGCEANAQKIRLWEERYVMTTLHGAGWRHLVFVHVLYPISFQLYSSEYSKWLSECASCACTTPRNALTSIPTASHALRY